MTSYELIVRKREGGELTDAELKHLVGTFVSGHTPDYQMAAFLMAVFFQGMTPRETLSLTYLMRDSGVKLDLASIPTAKVDKHSTGGVGDKVSLIVAPMVAELGLAIPMISGRGLGHSGGTLDKLEAIPGFCTQFSPQRTQELVRRNGLALVGQSSEMVPADKLLYELRDVTATVPCIPLIVSSILSKKLAEDLDALILDVKVGTGSFLQDRERTYELARYLVKVAEQSGTRTVALTTNMDAPLGRAVGNWLETREAILALQGEIAPDLEEVCAAVGGAMLWLGGKADDLAEGVAMFREGLTSGRGLERFRNAVEAQGGDTRVVDEPDSYPAAEIRQPFVAPTSGYIESIDAREVGLAGVSMGTGRARKEDEIDYGAGFVFDRQVGDAVEAGETIVEVHTDRPESLETVMARLGHAIRISRQPVARPPMVYDVISVDGEVPYS